MTNIKQANERNDSQPESMTFSTTQRQTTLSSQKKLSPRQKGPCIYGHYVVPSDLQWAPSPSRRHNLEFVFVGDTSGITSAKFAEHSTLSHSPKGSHESWHSKCPCDQGVMVSIGYSMFSALEMSKSFAWTAATDIYSDNMGFVLRNEKEREENKRRRFGWTIPS